MVGRRWKSIYSVGTTDIALGIEVLMATSVKLMQKPTLWLECGEGQRLLGGMPRQTARYCFRYLE